MKIKSNIRTQGFTLIELLVVIAIIGILSSIVIASLNSARTKGSVAAVKGSLAQVRAQAENYYDTNATYGASVSATVSTTGTVTSATGFVTDTVLQAQLKQAALQSSATTTITTNSGGNLWAISTTLKNGKQYCIANDGTNKEATTTASSAGACS